MSFDLLLFFVIIVYKAIVSNCIYSFYKGEFPNYYNTIAFKYTSTQACLLQSNGLLLFDIDRTDQMKIQEKYLGETPSNGIAFTPISLSSDSSQYALISLAANQTPKQWEIKVLNFQLVEEGTIPLSSISIDYSIKTISLFNATNVGYIAWKGSLGSLGRLGLQVYSFITQPPTLTPTPVLTATDLRDTFSCIGLVSTILCVYSSTPSNDCHIQFPDTSSSSVNRFLINQSVQGVKAFVIDKSLNKIVIYFIEMDFTFTFFSETIASTTSFNPSPNKKAAIDRCSADFNTFSFGQFMNGYAAVCTVQGEAKLQRFDASFNLISKSVTINNGLTQFTTTMTSLVAFDLARTGLFYEKTSSLNAKAIAYHIFITPTCATNNVINDVNKDVPKQLAPADFVSASSIDDASIQISFPSVPVSRKMTINNVLTVANVPYLINNGNVQIYYTSSDHIDDAVLFTLVNEAGIESSPCSLTVKVKVKVNCCYFSCLTCTADSTDPSNHKCSQCISNYYKKENENQANCYELPSSPSRYYLDVDVIKECDASCASCEKTSQKCLSCSSNYYPNENDPNPGYCYDASSTSISGYYLASTIYKRCDPSCDTCTFSSANCLTCASNYHKKAVEDVANKCYQDTVMSGYYLEGDVFKPCDISCNGCKLASTDCIKCASATYHKVKGAGNECFSESSKAVGFLISNDLYEPCDTSCKSCEYTSTTCTVCARGFNKVDLDPTNKCYTPLSKEIGYYLDGGLYKPCDKSCKRCFLSKNDCKECNGGYNQYKDSNNLIDSKCYDLTKADSNYYLKADGFFYDCDASCFKCTDSSAKCLACATGYHKDDVTSNTCYDDTLKVDDFYLEGDIFKPCDASCAKCQTKATHCTQCAALYHHLDGDAQANACYAESTKTNGYFIENDKYKLCDVSCVTCSGGKIACDSCRPNYYWTDDQKQACSNSEPMKYLNGDTWYPCYKSCETCNEEGTVNSHKCITCKTTTYPAEGKGDDMCYVASDLPGYYLNLTEKMFKSTLPAYEKDKLCTKCPIGEYCLEKTIDCITKDKAPSNTFVNELFNAIYLCRPNCKTCAVIWTNCTSCFHTHYYDFDPVASSAICRETCDSTRYSYKDIDNNKFCLDDCPKYTFPKEPPKDFKRCDLCRDNLYYYGANPTECLTYKPESTFVAIPEFNVLKSCKKPCSECESTETRCLSCVANNYPLSDDSTKCYPYNKAVPNYYYDSSTKLFEKCHPNCQTCIRAPDADCTNCLTCKPGDLANPLKEGNCEEKCASGLYYFFDKGTTKMECVSSCPSAYPIVTNSIQCVGTCKESGLELYLYEGQCVDACPVNTIGTKDDLVCHDLRDTTDLVNSIGLMILDMMNAREARVRRLTQSEDYVRLMNPGINFQLYTYAHSLKEDFHLETIAKQLSHLDLTECVLYLKKIYSVKEDDKIFIASFDIESPRVSPQIEYMIYSSDGEQLEMGFCKKAKLLVNLPLHGNNQVREAQDIFNASGYNILNSTDVFYRDICHRMKGPNDTDVLLESRFDYYYKSMSICEEGCSLTDVNLTTQRATCSCNCKTAFELTTQRAFVSALAIRPNDTALSYMKCYENVFTSEIFNGNIGNYFSLAMFALQVIIYVFFCIQSDKIVSLMLSKCISIRTNPPKKEQILHYIEQQLDNDILIGEFEVDDKKAKGLNSSVVNIKSKGKGKGKAKRKGKKKKTVTKTEAGDDHKNEAEDEEEEDDEVETKVITMTIKTKVKGKSKTKAKEEAPEEEDKPITDKANEVKDNKPNEVNIDQYTLKEFNDIRHTKAKKPQLKLNQNFMNDPILSDEDQPNVEGSGDKVECLTNKPETSDCNKNSNVNSNNSHSQSECINLRSNDDLEKPFRKEIKDDSNKFGFASIPLDSTTRKTIKSQIEVKREKTEFELLCEKEMKVYIGKSFFLIYLHFLQKHHRLINLIFSQEPYHFAIIKLSFFALSISFDLLLSTFFCLNSMIESRFESNVNDTSKVIGFGILAPFIGYFFMKILTWAMNYEDMFDKLNRITKEGTESVYNKEIGKGKVRLKWKLVLYFTTTLFFLVLVWYTATAFCGTFPNSQQLWGTMVGVSVGISLALPFIYYLLVATILYISIQGNSFKVFNLCRLALKV